jgi:short subunit dehydrogenase-like uncharacterized protein
MELDLVIVGATGFTGKLAVKYCAETYGNRISWGICGRDASKLEVRACCCTGLRCVTYFVFSFVCLSFSRSRDWQALRAETEAATKLASDSIRVIVADNLDRDAIAAMVKRAKVVVSFAGPFWK